MHQRSWSTHCFAALPVRLETCSHAPALFVRKCIDEAPSLVGILQQPLDLLPEGFPWQRKRILAIQTVQRGFWRVRTSERSVGNPLQERHGGIQSASSNSSDNSARESTTTSGR